MKNKIIVWGVIGCLTIASGIAACYLWKHHQPDQTVISIARDGTLYLASERLDLSQLSTRLKELAAKQQLLAIRADKDVKIKRIAEVMDACKAARLEPK